MRQLAVHGALSPSHLVEAGPPCPALKLVSRRIRREAADGAVIRPRSLGIILEAVGIPSSEGRFRSPPDNISLHHVQLLLLSGVGQVYK